jgi:MFS family permease
VSAWAVRSPRYQWWALVALLAGLLSLNITFTVFVVALPTVKADFNTNFSVLAWASTGPLLAFGVAAPFFGKAGDLFGHRRLYQFGLLGAMVSAVLTATAPDGRRDAAIRPGARRGARCGHRHGVHGDHPRAVCSR